MRKNTDLKQVKALAQTFLMLDIEQTDMSPIVVHHPFADSGFTVSQDSDGRLTPVNLLEDEKALQTWRQKMGEQIDKAESAFHIHMMVTTPYRMTFLKHGKALLGPNWTFQKSSAMRGCAQNIPALIPMSVNKNSLPCSGTPIPRS